jgi:hypothetical protein
VIRASLFLVAALAVSALGAAEKVENPYYAWWKMQKVGTAIVFTETFAGPKPSIQYQQVKLLEVKDDRVILENRVYAANVGPEKAEITSSFPVWATVTLPNKPGKHAAFAPAEKAEFVAIEKVKVGGKTYEAKKFKENTTFASIESQQLVWVSDTAPGLRLKSESQPKIGGKWVTDRTVEFKELKTP